MKLKCKWGICADDEAEAGPVEFMVLADCHTPQPHWTGACGLHAQGWYEGTDDNEALGIKDGVGPCYILGDNPDFTRRDEITRIKSVPKPDPKPPVSLQCDGDTYTILAVFQRSWGDDFEVCRDEGRTPIEQLAVELQEAYNEAGVAGHFKLFMPEV
jgi:hypothetical protein